MIVKVLFLAPNSVPSMAIRRINITVHFGVL